MTDADTPTFVGHLTVLAEALGEPMTPGRYAAYCLALRDLALPVLRGAVQTALRRCTFFPRPAELRALAGAGDLDASGADALVHRWLWRTALPDGAHDIVGLLVDRLGGRRVLEDMPVGVRGARVREAWPSVVIAARCRGISVPTMLEGPEQLGLEAPRLAFPEAPTSLPRNGGPLTRVLDLRQIGRLMP